MSGEERPELVRADEEALLLGAPRTLAGWVAPFNRWARIESAFEGTFLERISPGAFRKTFLENRDRIVVGFQHGRDPVVGDKPIGRLSVVREDGYGAWYEAALLDAPYVRDHVLPGLRENLYGSSFRFQVIKAERAQRPQRSAYNPEGIPEVTIRELRVRELGPVSSPAYAESSAGLRSLTDWYRSTSPAPRRPPPERLEARLSVIGAK
jgi:phage head maturation protease